MLLCLVVGSFAYYLSAYCNENCDCFVRLIYIPFLSKAPTAAPGNVRFIAVSSSSISVLWSRPDKSVLHGVLRRYIIEYRRIECNESDPVYVPGTPWSMVIVSNTSSSSEVIGGLAFWSCYQMRIRAQTVGYGPSSDVQQIRTAENCMLLILWMFFIWNYISDIVICVFLFAEEKGHCYCGLRAILAGFVEEGGSYCLWRIAYRSMDFVVIELHIACSGWESLRYA